MCKQLLEYPVREDAKQPGVLFRCQNGCGLQSSHPLEDEESGVVEEFVERRIRLRCIAKVYWLIEFNHPRCRRQRLVRERNGCSLDQGGPDLRI